MKKRLGLDIDGVLYPWQMVAYDYCTQMLGIESNSVEELMEDLDSEKYGTTFGYNLYHDPLLVTKKMVDPGIINTIKFLYNDYEIFYITTRPEEVRSGTEWWLKVSGFPYLENLILCTTKLPHIIENEIDFFVEDIVKYILGLKNYTQVIPVKHPWNKIIQDEFLCINSVVELPIVLEILNVS